MRKICPILLLLVVQASAEVTLEFVSAPDSVKTGEEFNLYINLSTDQNLEIYSYVYQGKKCYSFGNWKYNAEKYDFRGTKMINLTNWVKHEAESGNYTLKVRARGDKDYDLKKIITVEQVPVDLFKELPDVEEPSGFPMQFLIPLLASIPLLMLMIKKMFL